ncbi:MAG: SbcC/MukB-like Walker B domain-containing protein [Tunicatimonas sp.]
MSADPPYIDFGSSEEARRGYRLEALEVYNWGTFHRKIWMIEPSHKNALLTGDIGSGKSTLVDALTTLLVPHHRIVYNAAAGAQGKERSIRSYIRGEYKSVRELGTHAKAVALRDERKTYSVLLARFFNESLQERVTLAQVFWLEEQQEKKFFIVSRDLLTVQEHFTNFGADIAQLRTQLRRLPHTEVTDAFKDYSRQFRQYFGMSSEKTLQLFYQTVSMKSVDNLTTFVRLHMLDQTDAQHQLADLQKNFENLQQAHETVLKARRQTELLAPVVGEGKKYEAASRSIEQLESARQALPSWIAEQKYALLLRAQEVVQTELASVENTIVERARELEQLEAQADDVKKACYQSGGNRLQDIKDKIAGHEREKERRFQRAEQYQALARTFDFPAADTATAFERNRQEAEQILAGTQAEKQRLLEERDDQVVQREQLTQRKRDEEQELQSLRERQNQIPRQQIALREQLAQHLEVPIEQLPFVGELLQVRPEEADWEGAIERLLHSFALSLLLPEELYARVNRYVNQTNLRGRLVYYRTAAASTYTSADVIADNSLLHKIDIKPDTPFEDWLERELEKRFDYACANTMSEFQSLSYAITREGLVKQGRARHEKDDRRALSDRRSYVLGWSNTAKLRAVQQEIEQLDRQFRSVEQAIAGLNRQREAVDQRAAGARDLGQFGQFEEIHWQEIARIIQALQAEMTTLAQASDTLRQLKDTMERLADEIRAGRKQKEESLARRGALHNKRDAYATDLEQTARLRELVTPEERSTHFPALEKLAGTRPFRLETAESYRQEVLDKINRRLEKKNSEKRGSSQRLVGLISAFTRAFPSESVELGASPDYLPELRDLHKKLVKDDLPKFETRFRDLLRKGTINDVLLFKNKLEAASNEIVDKIDLINQSLREIEYSPGTYIRLVPDQETDAEIRNFQTDLKNCLKDTLGQEDYYNEEKYLQVKKLLDRFNSEESAEKRWKDKVTDVRNWYSFGASERNRETEEETNYYSDSGGKSGGQKEKLAYTVLASALAYQYGIHDEQKNRRSFRFVVIDEAFGRGSDESTRFGLELFKKMNLQLLIVTPLQKINIIEHYIDFVHFISNPLGNQSEITNLTKKEYLEKKTAYLQEN